jgi:FkbM family methyltransferase
VNAVAAGTIAREPSPLTFDRMTGRLEGANAIERIAGKAMQVTVRATTPFHFRGLSYACRAMRAVLPARDVSVRLSEDSVFAFPFGDGYWTCLLDRHAMYEPEIDAFLRAVADVDYMLVDGGANFGLWSVLASSRAYGGHEVLAIEASPANADRLAANARLNGNRFTVLRRALGLTDGARAWIAGSKHEGMSISGVRAGEGVEIGVVSLDGLLDHGAVQPGRRLVVKLDVEGVEIEAMQGGRRLLAGDAVVICEDHGSDRTHRVSRYLLNETPWTLFAFDPRKRTFVRLTDVAMLDAVKVSGAKGYNIFAATSPFWASRLAAAGSQLSMVP